MRIDELLRSSDEPVFSFEFFPPKSEVRDDDEAIAEFGVSYATLQCAELLAGGAPGIHFITLNRSPATRAILAALKLMRPWNAAWTALEEDSLALG